MGDAVVGVTVAPGAGDVPSSSDDMQQAVCCRPPPLGNAPGAPRLLRLSRVKGHWFSTDWLVDGCGVMNSLLEAEEQRTRDWAI
jgi:hypothetical protein